MVRKARELLAPRLKVADASTCEAFERLEQERSIFGPWAIPGLLLVVETLSVDRKCTRWDEQVFLHEWVATIESLGFKQIRYNALPRSHALAFVATEHPPPPRPLPEYAPHEMPDPHDLRLPETTEMVEGHGSSQAAGTAPQPRELSSRMLGSRVLAGLHMRSERPGSVVDHLRMAAARGVGDAAQLRSLSRAELAELALGSGGEPPPSPGDDRHST
mmetsp:Transcript_13448/g.40779  ORF Transcript_13448/g.40779 Transcript_13448/m.40779 type:complete len:217 (+) Transcript_13448:1030-1680(+)